MERVWRMRRIEAHVILVYEAVNFLEILSFIEGRIGLSFCFKRQSQSFPSPPSVCRYIDHMLSPPERSISSV